MASEIQPRKVKVMADYSCWPLWNLDEPGNIDPRALPISSRLADQLIAWVVRYDETLDPDDPGQSGFPDPIDEMIDALNERGGLGA